MGCNISDYGVQCGQYGIGYNNTHIIELHNYLMITNIFHVVTRDFYVLGISSLNRFYTLFIIFNIFHRVLVKCF